MAITDNNFTQQEFNAAIDANPELINHVKTSLSNKKFIVQDEETHRNYLKNHEEGFAKSLTKVHAETLEKDVYDLTGIDKLPEEKYYDYFKRATAERLKGVTEMQKELETLRKGNQSDNAGRIKQLEEAIQAEKENSKTLLAEKEKTINEIKISSIANNALAKLSAKYRKDLPEGLVKIGEQTALNELLKVAKFQEDGNITITGEDGSPMLDKDTYKPLTPEQWLSNFGTIKEMIDPSADGKGAGTGKSEQPENPGTGGFQRITSLPANIKTKVELNDYMARMGYVDGSKEKNEDYEKFGNKLPLR